MLRIQKIPIKELCAFAERSLGLGLTPISLHRALAHSRNPCADGEDIGLLVAFQEDKPIGYLAVMPSFLQYNGTLTKMYWLSTWYVPEQHRGSGVGSLLMMTAISLRHDLVASAPGMGADARKVYRALGFQEVGPLEYCRLNFERLNPFHRMLFSLQSRLAKKGWRLRGIGLGLRLSSLLFTPCRKLIPTTLSRRQLRQIQSSLSYEEVPSVDEFMVNGPPDPFARFYRGPEVLNWMLRDKWILERSHLDERQTDYQFSAFRDRFRYIALKLYRRADRSPRGFAIMSVSSQKAETILKLLDYHLCDDSIFPEFLAIVLNYCASWHATALVFPASLRPHLASGTLVNSAMETGQIHYFARPGLPQSPLACALKDIQLGIYDGDMAFT